jgi:Ca2+-binding RTX toxin-like protein
VSYKTLGGPNWYDDTQLPAVLRMEESAIDGVYNDGKGNPTIGIGLNIKDNKDILAIVLSQMIFTGPGPFTGESVFQAAAVTGTSAEDVVNEFNTLIDNFPLPSGPDANDSKAVRSHDPSHINASTKALTTLLNSLLAQFFGLTSGTQLPADMVHFSRFPKPNQVSSLTMALRGVNVGTDASMGDYPTIAGYSASLISRLTSAGVPAGNLPNVNSGAWEGLVSLYFNSRADARSLIGPHLINALKENDAAQVWYEIRYDSNLAQDPATATRRFEESQLVSLAQPDATFGTTIQAYEMLEEHRTSILQYENTFGTDPDSSNPNKLSNQLSAAARNISYVAATGNAIAAPITPIQTVEQAFESYAQTVASALNDAFSAVTGGVAIDFLSANGNHFTVESTDILVAPDAVDISDNFATTTQVDVHPIDHVSAPHVILGPMSIVTINPGVATLSGGIGNDLLVAGAGDEFLNAGLGNDTLIGGVGIQGNDTLALIGSTDPGNDTLQGGLGNDVFVFSLATTSANLVETILPYKQAPISKGAFGWQFSQGIDGAIDVVVGNTPTKLGGTAAAPLKFEVSNSGFLWSADSSTAGVQYSFDSNTDELTISNSAAVADGGLGSNEIVIKNFNLSAAESSGGFLGIHLQAPPPSVNWPANVGIDPPVPNFVAGSSSSYTISELAAQSTDQEIQVSLSGANPAAFEIVTAQGVETINPNGTFEVQLLAGESNVSFALVNIPSTNPVPDLLSSATLQLAASMTDPDSATNETLISGALSFGFTPSFGDTAPSPVANDSISGTYDTLTGITTFTGDGGDDFIAASGSNNYVNATLSGNDSIVGGSNSNTILGGQGNNAISLSGTSDLVSLGGGHNTVNGGMGHDTIESNTGDDIVNAHNGRDIIILGNGANEEYADTQTSIANAITFGSTGTATGLQGDLLSVQDGDNTIVGGAGNDLIDVGSGHDVIVLGPGNDTFEGGVEVTGANATWSVSVAGDLTTGLVVAENQVANYTNPYSNAAFSQPYNGVSSQATGKPASSADDTIFGGSGNDLLLLGNGDNYVDSGNGADTILGGMGNDTIELGCGNDFVRGGGGTTYVRGGTGHDTLIGGDGDNTIIGGSGDSTINASNGPNGIDFANASLTGNYVYGGSGNDIIYGSLGSDTLIGGSGNTTLIGQGGNEYFVGGSGNDYLQGSAGNNTLVAGGAGTDTLVANGSNTSNSILYGGAGTNEIIGGSGQNTLYAGSGGVTGAADTLAASGTDASSHTTIFGGSGVDILQGGAGSSVIYAGNGGTAAAPTTLISINGNDTLYGGSGTDQLFGGSGTDVIYAGDGGTSSAPTSVYGGTGLATLIAGAGDALLLDASSGSDLIMGGTANDTLEGLGNDTISSGTGSEQMQTDGGTVTFQVNSGFGNDSVTESGNYLYGVQFGTGIETSDLAGAVVFDDADHAYLDISGDGGDLQLSNALIGNLQSVSFADSGSIDLPTFMTDLFGSDQTFTDDNGNNVFINVLSSAAISASFGQDEIASFGSNTTLTGGATSDSQSIYSDGASARLVSGFGDDLMMASGDHATIVGGASGDQIIVDGADAEVDLAGIPGAFNAVKIAGANDTVNAPTSSSDSLIEIDNASALVQVASGAGNIQINSSVSYTLPTNTFVLTLIGSANIVGTGNALADVITGGAGNDTLVAGSSGADTLLGGTGNTTFVINSSGDVVLDSFRVGQRVSAAAEGRSSVLRSPGHSSSSQRSSFLMRPRVVWMPPLRSTSALRSINSRARSRCYSSPMRCQRLCRLTRSCRLAQSDRLPGHRRWNLAA